jgi:hypothetical protein
MQNLLIKISKRPSKEFFTSELSAQGVVKDFSRLTETCKNLEILCGNSG